MTRPEGPGGDLLEGLVQAYSPSGDETPAARVLSQWLTERGIEASQDAVGNVIAQTGPRDPDTPTILLLGHLDTVPGRLDVAWEAGELRGRGAVDAKGPLTTHALALDRVGDALDADVVLAAAVGEETDSRGARHLVQTLQPPDALIIAEPTGVGTVGLGYKGRVQARVKARSEAAHPGAPVETAAETVHRALSALTEWTQNPTRDVGVDETTLRILDFDAERSGDEHVAQARIDLRVPGTAPSQQQLEEAIGQDADVIVAESLPAVRAARGNPVATALRGGILRQGIDPRASVKTGTSDWNVVSRHWACPGAAYGPGDPSLDHTPREAIDLEAVQTASEVLYDALSQLARQLGGDAPSTSSEQRGPHAGL